MDLVRVFRFPEREYPIVVEIRGPGLQPPRRTIAHHRDFGKFPQARRWSDGFPSAGPGSMNDKIQGHLSSHLGCVSSIFSTRGVSTTPTSAPASTATRRGRILDRF